MVMMDALVEIATCEIFYASLSEVLEMTDNIYSGDVELSQCFWSAWGFVFCSRYVF